MTTVQFTATEEERELVAKIVARAAEVYQRQIGGLDRLNLSMDLIATHANGCPLDFQKLLDADDFNFTHDVNGISKHIDRETGELGGCFRPRCAKPAAA